MDLSKVDQSNIYFHLGLEKTGSTFYQNTIFKNLKGLKYHRKSRFKRFEKILEKDPHGKHLFAFETDIEFFNTVDKVAKYLPEARVFIILRRQDSWLSSKYHYHIRKHGYSSLREFFDLKNDAGERKKDEFYHRKKIDYIESKIKTPILFLNYSELKEDAEKYVGRIISFLGAELDSSADIHKPRKKAFSLKQNRILMRFNRMYKYKKANTGSKFWNKVHYKYREFLLHIVAFFGQFVPKAWVSKDPIIDKEYLEEVREYFEEDWKYALSKVNKI